MIASLSGDSLKYLNFWQEKLITMLIANPKMYYIIISREVEDAQKIRMSVIDCFEKAVLPSLSDEERRTNLHFIVVGGGPTGVEFAAELHDFVQADLVKLYPSVKDIVKITVIQSGDHILNT